LPTRAASSHHARPRTSWAGVPAAERRAERRAALLAAGFDLLGTEGSAGTTVRAVCQRARLNARYFYESFDDLDALIVAVYDRVVEELGAEVLTALDTTTDPAARVRAAVDRIVRFVDDDRRRARVLYVEALGNEALNRRRIETGHSIVAFVDKYATERHGPAAPGEQVGLMGAAILVGGFSELLTAWLDRRIAVSRTRLVDDATALFLALGDATAAIARQRRLAD
jgi:AcrR family transcriptional regulator